MTIKIGINGMGRIGRMVLRSIIERNNKKIEIKHINNRTGPEVCASLIKYDSIHGRFNSEIKFDDKNLKQASISEVLSTSDIVSIHIPLSSGTKNMINKDAFKQMKESIILINTSRGGIVDEVELYKFLKNNNLAFASFDVFEHEPAFKSPLLKLDNFFASSHRASLTEQGIQSMGIAAINGLGD